MHDPLTVAFEIKYPWWRDKPWPKCKVTWRQFEEREKVGHSKHWKEGYRDTFITIWHKDPEKGGSDNSCGFSYVRLGKKRLEILHNAAWSESHNPHFLCCSEKEWCGSISDAESLKRGLYLLVARVLRLKMTFDQAAKYASEGTHIRDVSKVGSTFCYVPGYHSNSQKDTPEWRQQHFEEILAGVARVILTDRRPWYRHPRWHVWHWRIQIHPWKTFRRWAFDRCSKCGGRFKWGTSDVIGDWGGKRIWHRACDDSAKLHS